MSFLISQSDYFGFRLNRPFPSSLVPLFQNESKCETILMKMTDLHENETACRTHFHMKGFALRLVLKQRHKRTRKWPIENRSMRHTVGEGTDWNRNEPRRSWRFLWRFCFSVVHHQPFRYQKTCC